MHKTEEGGGNRKNRTKKCLETKQKGGRKKEKGNRVKTGQGQRKIVTRGEGTIKKNVKMEYKKGKRKENGIKRK